MLHRILLIFVALAAILLCQGCHTTTPTTKAHNAADILEIAIPAVGIRTQHHLSQTAGGKLIASWVESNDEAMHVIRSQLGNNPNYLFVYVCSYNNPRKVGAEKLEPTWR